MTEPRVIWELCRDCATVMDRPGNPGRVEAVSRLLFGTAAHESDGFAFRRQTSPRWDGPVGGFSLWQEERGSINAGMVQLATTGALREKAARFLFGIDWGKAVAAGWPMRWDESFVVELLRCGCGDRLGVLLARLHYLRCPGAIPGDVHGQAAYWKQWYNTVAGKGTVEEYLEHWARWCAPVVGQ